MTSEEINSVNARRAVYGLPPVLHGEHPEPIYIAKLRADAVELAEQDKAELVSIVAAEPK